MNRKVRFSELTDEQRRRLFRAEHLDLIRDSGQDAIVELTQEHGLLEPQVKGWVFVEPTRRNRP